MKVQIWNGHGLNCGGNKIGQGFWHPYLPYVVLVNTNSHQEAWVGQLIEVTNSKNGKTQIIGKIVFCVRGLSWKALVVSLSEIPEPSPYS